MAPGLAEMTVVFVGFPVHMLVGALRSMMTMLFCTGRRMTKGLVFESQGIPGSSSLDATWRVVGFGLAFALGAFLGGGSFLGGLGDRMGE